MGRYDASYCLLCKSAAHCLALGDVGCADTVCCAAVEEDGCDPPEDVVCYGLGDLDDFSGSHQLALLLLLAEELRILPRSTGAGADAHGKAAAFDPIHTAKVRPTPRPQALVLVISVFGCQLENPAADFYVQERRVLQQLDIVALQFDERARRVVSRPTLFYMPVRSPCFIVYSLSYSLGL